VLMIFMIEKTVRAELCKKKIRSIFFAFLIFSLLAFVTMSSSRRGNIEETTSFFRISENRKYLGEFVQGKDYIAISGRLITIENGQEVPLVNVRVYLYMNVSQNSYLLSENLTDEDGRFLFNLHVDETYPIGEVNFTVIYPGSINLGLAPTRIYYYAIIKEPQRESNPTGAWTVIGILIAILVAGSILSIKSMYSRRERAGGMPVWREILNSMIEQAKRRDINFVLLIRELVDSLCKRYGIIPKFGSPLQQKVLLLKEAVSEEVFNVLKNLISLYELMNYGGPYARTILISTMDFDTWRALLDMVSKELGGK